MVILANIDFEIVGDPSNKGILNFYCLTLRSYLLA